MAGHHPMLEGAPRVSGAKALPQQRDARIVLAVFGAGIAVRIAFLVGYRPAFLGISDSGSYLLAAQGQLFSDVLHPAGCGLFLRIVNVPAPGLGAIIALQHALGVLAAFLLYRTVLRVTGRPLLGLIPAALVMFDGLELWVEHAPLSDSLFSVLVAAALHETVRAGAGARSAFATTGMLVAAAWLVRLPVLALWILLAAPGHLRARVIGAGTVCACTLLLVLGYVVVQHSKTGFTGTTPAGNRALYARVAPFADCRSFSPPGGTRPLCQGTPPARRGSPNSYLWGIPDGSVTVPKGGRGVLSPAWRAFGGPPGGDGRLGAFARAAILHRPLDYVAAVARDFHYYWAANPRAFDAAAAKPIAGVVDAARRLTGGPVGVHAPALGALKAYEAAVAQHHPEGLPREHGALLTHHDQGAVWRGGNAPVAWPDVWAPSDVLCALRTPPPRVPGEDEPELRPRPLLPHYHDPTVALDGDGGQPRPCSEPGDPPPSRTP